MPVGQSRGKTIWFIDAAYLFYCQDSVAPDFQFDYRKLKEFLEEGQPFWQVHYFNSTPNPPTDQQNGFHTWLRRELRFILHLSPLGRKTVTCQHCGQVSTIPIQKGVDVGLVTTMLSLGQQGAYDTAVLSAGDLDFRDAIVYERDVLGKNIEIAAFRKGLSGELADLASRVIILDDFAEAIRKEPRERERPA